MKADLPIERLYDLGDLSDAGFETRIVATPTELARIAAWESVESVSRFEGQIVLKRRSQTRFVYESTLEADIVQSCVVTLEPVNAHILRTFSRDLHYVPLHPKDKGGVITLASAEDETPEEIESLRFNLAGPLLEEFSLAVDPYPRAPGVTFEPAAEEGARTESPFAVLKSLKRG